MSNWPSRLERCSVRPSPANCRSGQLGFTTKSNSLRNASRLDCSTILQPQRCIAIAKIGTRDRSRRLRRRAVDGRHVRPKREEYPDTSRRVGYSAIGRDCNEAKQCTYLSRPFLMNLACGTPDDYVLAFVGDNDDVLLVTWTTEASPQPRPCLDSSFAMSYHLS